MDRSLVKKKGKSRENPREMSHHRGRGHSADSGISGKSLDLKHQLPPPSRVCLQGRVSKVILTPEHTYTSK